MNEELIVTVNGQRMVPAGDFGWQEFSGGVFLGIIIGFLLGTIWTYRTCLGLLQEYDKRKAATDDPADWWKDGENAD